MSYQENPPKTGLEPVAYWESVGVIGSPPDIAVGHNATLGTFNVKHYRVIPGLSIDCACGVHLLSSWVVL